MTAMAKAREAEFYLGKMRKSYTNVEEEFVYYLSAFLAASRSIPDHLLEEYNVKYGLNLPLTEKLYADRFESRAKEIHHSDALRFIRFWKERMNALQRDPIGGLIISMRNLNVHRVVVKPDLVKVEITDTFVFTDSVRVEKFDKEGKLVEVCESPREHPMKPEEVPARVDWYFKEYEKEPIIAVCERFLAIIKDFVDETRRSF